MKIERLMSGVVGVVLASGLQDVALIFCVVLIFEVVDFLTGIWKSAVLAKQNGEHFAFESVKAWRTIYKVILIFFGLCMTWAFDQFILPFEPFRLEKGFAAFVCGVELWSFLENASIISDYPLFVWLRKFMKTTIENKTNIKIEEE